MASYSYTIKYGTDWSATVTVNYTTSYNASTNQTTVTISNVSWAYFGRKGWGTSCSSTITVTAADNTSSTGNTSASASGTTNGGVKTFTYTPDSPVSISVVHGSGAGTKSITIDIASTIQAYAFSSSTSPSTINGNGSTTVTSATTYSLTISQGSNTTITVKRNGSTLSNGAILMTGDSLTIIFSAAAGYTLSTSTVNGNTFSSGGTHSVTGNVTVKSAVTLNTYTLTINQGTGTIISVKKGSTTLKHGDTISHGDSLTISISANTEYNLETHKVNGKDFTSESYIVDGVVIVESTASVKSFIIEIPTVSNCTFSIIRTYSPLQNANIGSLSDNDTIYYNDVISITANSAAGYGISSLTVNGTNFENGASIRVTEKVTINASVIVTTTFTVTISQKGGTGELIQVFNGETRVTNGESVIQGSQLTYILNIPDNYWVKNFSINDNIKYVNSAISFTIEVAENPSVDTSVLQNITIPIIRRA